MKQVFWGSFSRKEGLCPSLPSASSPAKPKRQRQQYEALLKGSMDDGDWVLSITIFLTIFAS
jgi:hypothetical protein